MRGNDAERLADALHGKVHDDTLPDVEGLFILTKARGAKSLAEIVGGEVDGEVGEIRRFVVDDRRDAAALVVLGVSRVHFDDPAIFQQFAKAMSAGIEACSEEDDLGRAVLHGPLERIVDEAGAQQHHPGEANDCVVLAGFVVVLLEALAERVTGDECEFLVANQAIG